MDKILEFTFDDIFQIVVTSIVVYILIIIYVRVLGKRSTSQMNNFDWIVTVSIGSLLASSVILKNVSVVEGAISVFVLMGLQFLLTKGIIKSKLLRKVTRSNPRLLFLEGEFIKENMELERILKPEIFAAIRQNGFKSINQIYAVVIETNSKISIIPNENADELAISLSFVDGLPDELSRQLEMHNKE